MRVLKYQSVRGIFIVKKSSERPKLGSLKEVLKLSD
jgi:hypothetical protein